MDRIADDNLSEALKHLRPSERRVIEKHLAGEKTEESWELVRRIKASLKRRARRRLPKRFVWLA